MTTHPHLEGRHVLERLAAIDPDWMERSCPPGLLRELIADSKAALAALPGGGVCWCEACRPVTFGDMRMVLCPDCGNKRCPHATHHANRCTGSNEPGQTGSAYAAPSNAAIAQAVDWVAANGGGSYKNCRRDILSRAREIDTLPTPNPHEADRNG